MLLKELNPLKHDPDLGFIAGAHQHTYKGMPVRAHATGMTGRYWRPFDGEGVVDGNFRGWKASENGKYRALIRYLELVEERDEEHCKSAIRALWAAEGALAARLGTQMHKLFEQIVEGIPLQIQTPETRIFTPWYLSFLAENELEPFRTELQLVKMQSDGVTPLVAGMADLFLRRKGTDQYVLIDYKRTDPKPKYKGCKPNLFGSTKPGYFAASGYGPFEGLADTDEMKYAMQLNVYAHIAATEYGIDARDHMYLVQVHENLDHVHVARVDRHDAVMDDLFAREEALARAEREADGELAHSM
jgi:hypothetical protein